MDEDSLETSASDSSADRQGNVTIVPVNKFRLVRLWAPESGYTLAIVGGRAQSDMRGGFQTRMSKKLREIVFVFVFVFPPGAAVAPSRRGVVPGAAGGCLPPGRREGTYGCYLDSAPDRGDTSPYLIKNPNPYIHSFILMHTLSSMHSIAYHLVVHAYFCILSMHTQHAYQHAYLHHGHMHTSMDAIHTYMHTRIHILMHTLIHTNAYPHS
jgi:hypothetical protein